MANLALGFEEEFEKMARRKQGGGINRYQKNTFAIIVTQ
jgi:hypothetical protein